jgi:hypothetical protein
MMELVDEFSRHDIVSELVNNETLLYQGEDDYSSSGSDSEPSDDNLDKEDLAMIIPKRLIKTSVKKKNLN